MRLSFDTNILVYAYDSEGGERHLTAASLVSRAAKADCVQSLQSYLEFFNVATRKVGMPPARARYIIGRWRAAFKWCAADEEVMAAALDAVEAHGLSVWDAVLWATVRDAGCRILFTEDFQDGRTLDGVTFVNPFLLENARYVDLALPPA